MQRLPHLRVERGEVACRQRAAGGLHIGRDAFREIAFVEIARTLRGQLLDRGFQSVLRQMHLRTDAPLRIGRQAVLQVGGGTRRVAPQVGGRLAIISVIHHVDQQAFTGQSDGETEQIAPGHFRMAAMRLFQGSDRAGAAINRLVHAAIVLYARQGKMSEAAP